MVTPISWLMRELFWEKPEFWTDMCFWVHTVATIKLYLMRELRMGVNWKLVISAVAWL